MKLLIHALLTAITGALLGTATQAAEKAAIIETSSNDWCIPITMDGETKRTICADVVALDQPLVYNRFGTFNPFGMIYALRRDVVPANEPPKAYSADACDELNGTETYPGELKAGEVRLKDCKRPRPLVLRANVGDVLHVRIGNLLRPDQPGLTENFCRQNGLNKKADFKDGSFFNLLRNWVSAGPQDAVDHEEAMCLSGSDERPQGKLASPAMEWPRSRGLNFSVQGLTAVDSTGEVSPDVDRVCTGLAAIQPGDKPVDCYYLVDREGTYFVASNAAPAGGEGNGGSITHGLFGAVVGERAGTSWFRSQIGAGAFRKLWTPKETNGGDTPARHAIGLADLQSPYVEYADLPGSDPERSSILNMVRRTGDNAYEIIHSDLNAIVYRKKDASDPKDEGISFREFSVFFHDELKSFFTRNFEELGLFGEGQLAGVRDGFAINYGSSGMGTMLLANRKGIGPAANCKECLYEEFFLTSWANGDPALLEQFGDDPSNVHHSYLNDRIVFRNFHAGPKETHVFHLHAHQWFSGNDSNRGSYLDSQTVGPQQGFTYDIYGGGLSVYHKGEGGKPGWYETLGSGNRNRTLGDSIFHCHLYPHFAQGMWELWRVHDVLEDGTRKLPDGQKTAGLSLEEASDADKRIKRPGSVDPATGAWIKSASEDAAREVGTPIPAIVPLPGQPWPLLPTYSGETTLADAQADGQPAAPDPAQPITSMPGYPFYVGGKPGHRPPQAPNDIARALPDDGGTSTFLDGGLPRHVLTDAAERQTAFKLPAELAAPFNGSSGRNAREKLQSQAVAKALAMGDMTMHIEKAKLAVLPYEGSAIEKAGMAFHHNGRIDGGGVELDLRMADGTKATFQPAQGGYKSVLSGALATYFPINGAPPKPGAPFSDPCGAPDGYANATAQGSGEQKKYVFTRTDGGGQTRTFDLMVVRNGESAPLTPEKLEPASDGNVSNWTKWWRTDPVADEQGELQDREPRPALYYVDNNNVVEFPLAGNIVLAEVDPFVDDGSLSSVFTTDPAVVGFRRYQGSAVQLDMVTNRAGWHDPQARINVLTRNSNRYKEGGGRISPRISGDEEPFFFRAQSGECIEFRHTNELPKDLALDDFQVKTPTDTIGQHIHLVKFDVTSSDGSGNGFNYEDGTLAADEIASRICAAKNDDEASVVANRAAGEARIRELPGLCAKDAEGHWAVSSTYKDSIWRLKLTENRDLFQTTVQRWFADPILSATNITGDGMADRTMRTVFSHDHFGPSSIQQHGFYTALVVEPQASRTCRTGKTFKGLDGELQTSDRLACTEQRTTRDLVVADDIDVGTQRVIHDPDSLDQENPSYREFALAIADFATLYDPRDRMSKDVLTASFATKKRDAPYDAEAEVEQAAESIQGMATLVCEAKYAIVGQPGNMRSACASVLERDKNGWYAPAGDAPPAWLAAAKPGDSNAHRSGLSNLLDAGEIDALQAYMLSYRAYAAGYDSAEGPGVRLAKAVAMPRRPESISVNHHDPYLLNYRGEPLPLRVGQGSSGSDCRLKPLDHWEGALETGVKESCSIDRQKTAAAGNMAGAFQSREHGDPVTPIVETYAGDRVQFRLIQGAQEVQHTLTLEGYTWPRNIDQKFPASMRMLEDVAPADTLLKACQNEKIPATTTAVIRGGRADQYQTWLREGIGSDKFDADDRTFWEAYETLIANCFNAEGRTVAQEVGISEHFEIAGSYRNDFMGERLRVASQTAMAAQTAETAVVSAINDRTPTDTLLHFGSVDALWNGAWGMLRVYKDGEASDPAEPLDKPAEEKALHQCIVQANPSTQAGLDAIRACLDGVTPVGSRIEPLAEIARAESLVASRSVKTEAVACKYDAPVVHAAAVAIESRTVFGRNGAPIHDVGTRYGNGTYDRNGLFFALLDTRSIASANGRSDDDYLSDPAAWGQVPLSRIVNAIKAAYSRPEPFVLTVNAGDCVKLTIVNALGDHAGTGGLMDDLGDAWMPKIVPLNTEPDWTSGKPYRAQDIGKNPEHANMPLRYEQIAGRQLRGSARLAVVLPLPALNYQQRIARPFGYNATGALAPVTIPQGGNLSSVRLSADNGLQLWRERTGQIEQMTFYAGRVGTPNDFDISHVLTADNSNPQLLLDFRAGLLDLIRAPLGLAPDATPAMQVLEIGSSAEAQDVRLPLYYGGRVFRMEVNTGSVIGTELGQALGTQLSALQPQIEALWRDYAELKVADKLHFVPYAFGALPLKSAGDVIGHPLHGLIGSVDVVPRSAQLDRAPVVIGQRSAGAMIIAACEVARETNPRACTINAVTPQKAGLFGRPIWQTVSTVTYPKDTPGHTVREYTLFWQDGLNLRDRASADRFIPLGPVGRPALVADCKVCDDSYDFGEEGVNYRSAAYNIRLRSEPDHGGGLSPESHFDLNAYQFGNEFFALRPDEVRPGKTPEAHVLRAEEDDEVVIHVLHPGGRARQRAFITVAQDYDDLFPGFGFPHAALLGPGKAVNASLTRKLKPGCYLWHDGPMTLTSGGVWGLLDVVGKNQANDLKVTSCARRGGSHAPG